MAELDSISVLVLGPMRPPANAGGGLEPETAPIAARTEQLTKLVRSIVAEIMNQLGVAVPVRVDGPDTNVPAQIIPGILRKIESADLIICDLSDNSTNVMYELGLIHALGLPYLLVTSEARRPFYVSGLVCITRLVLTDSYDPTKTGQQPLLNRIREFLDTERPLPPVGDVRRIDFADNPVTDFFGGLPIADISATAGLAAGYWVNSILRFVRRNGYFEPPARTVTFADAGLVVDKINMVMRHFIAVKPVNLEEAYNNELTRLEQTLHELNLRVIEGTIIASERGDLRPYGGKFLGRVQPDGEIRIIEPGIVVEIPTTLYALQQSARIMRIDNLPTIFIAEPRARARLRSRLYRQMLDRFGQILQFHLQHSENKGHADQVHFINLPELPTLLAGLLPTIQGAQPSS